MQKLLIVLAIQFCLPACSALLARLSPRAAAWQLEIYVVLINAAFFGFAMGMLPKRWPWIAGMGLLFAAYAGVWLPAYLGKNTLNNYGWENFEYLGYTALGVLLVGGFLFQDYSLVCELPAEQYGAAMPHWRFRLLDLFWVTGLVAFAALGFAAYYRNKHQLVPEEFMILSGGDYFYAALGLPFFYQALRPSLNWRRVALWGLGLLAVLVIGHQLMTFLIRPRENQIILGFLDHLLFVLSLALLALGSALLYRWAGLRIVDYRTRNFWSFERPGKR